MPVTVITALPSESVVSPDVPDPFEPSATVAVPLLAPACVPVSPTVIAFEVLPAARFVIGPPAIVAGPVTAPAVTFSPSWNPTGATCVLPIVTAWLSAPPPTWKFPSDSVAGTFACACR